MPVSILIPKPWTDYQLLDCGDGQRLERFGSYLLVRPDPQILWKKKLPQTEWNKFDAVFDNGWRVRTKVPPNCKLRPFKHTGVFPEQAVHWDWMKKILEDRRSKTDHPLPSILNLFAYTGLSSLIAVKAGGKVTHVDASYPTVSWAKENQLVSNLPPNAIRWILDDAIKFLMREIKRGVKYDGIMMDPPIYGHGPKGERWDFNIHFPKLIELCIQVLVDRPLFVVVNTYAISSSAIMLENVLRDYLPEGNIESGELVLQETGPGKRLLSTGIFARWSKD